MYPSSLFCVFFFFNDTATTEIYTLSLHDALPISMNAAACSGGSRSCMPGAVPLPETFGAASLIARASESSLSVTRSEEHTSELQSRLHLVCRLLLEKKKKIYTYIYPLNHDTNSLI